MCYVHDWLVNLPHARKLELTIRPWVIHDVGTEAVGSPGARLPQQAFHCSAIRDPPKPAKLM